LIHDSQNFVPKGSQVFGSLFFDCGQTTVAINGFLVVDVIEICYNAGRVAFTKSIKKLSIKKFYADEMSLFFNGDAASFRQKQ